MAMSTPVARPSAINISLVVPAPKSHHVRDLLILLSCAVVFSAFFIAEMRNPVLANAEVSMLLGP